jgi:MFS family permease
MFAFVAAGSGVYVYLDPIARLMNLGPGVVAAAVQGNLVAQILGGLTVTTLAGRVRYPVIFVAAGSCAIGVYVVYLGGAPAVGFVLATCVTGFSGMIMTPYFVPFALAADPGRRVAAMSGGAQILGGAGGPLVAATLGGHPRQVVMLAMGWIVVSVCIALSLAATHKTVEKSPVFD